MVITALIFAGYAAVVVNGGWWGALLAGIHIVVMLVAAHLRRPDPRAPR